MVAYHPCIASGIPAQPPQPYNPALEAARAKSKIGPRRKRLMSRIFYALEKSGGKVEGNEDSAAVSFDGQRLIFRAVEKLRQVKLPLTEWDKRFKNTSFKRGYNVGLEPTGTIKLEIETYLRSRVRQVWQETDNQPAESVLEEFVEALKKGARVLDEWDEERRTQEEARRRAEERRARARHEAKVDEERWQLLVRLGTAHTEAQLVTSLINSLTANNTAEQDAQIGDRSLREWLDWLGSRLEKQGMPSSLEGLFQRVYAVAQNVPAERDY